MGRVLEALKQRAPLLESRLQPAEAGTPTFADEGSTADEPPALALAAPGTEEVQEPTTDDEIPFIEVGGRGAIEGSPAVLAAGPAIRETKALPSVPEKATPPPEPGAIRFRPLPPELRPLAPPDRRLAPDLVAWHRPDDLTSVQFRTVLAAIEEQRPTDRAQVLLFTGLSAETSTTSVLLNLAITAARQGDHRVLVVEANRKSPAIACRLGLLATPGLGEVLAGTVAAPRAVQETGVANLWVLAAGRPAAVHGTRLAGEAMRSVLTELRKQFDRIFLDAGWWDGRPELVALSSLCDGVYLVLPGSEEEKPYVADLLRDIARQSGRLEGCVLTQP